MPTKEELKRLFLQRGDEELLKIYFNKGDYTPEAVEAMDEILNERDGAEKWIKEKEQERIKQAEADRVKQTVYNQLLAGQEVNVTGQSMLTAEEIQQIIAREQGKVQAVISDEKVTGSVVGKAIAGGLLGAVLGGVMWGLMLIYSGHIFYILGGVLWLLCYGLIKLLTGRSKNNIAVLVISILAAIAGAGIGFAIYSAVGPK